MSFNQLYAKKLKKIYFPENVRIEIIIQYILITISLNLAFKKYLGMHLDITLNFQEHLNIQ